MPESGSFSPLGRDHGALYRRAAVAQIAWLIAAVGVWSRRRRGARGRPSCACVPIGESARAGRRWRCGTTRGQRRRDGAVSRAAGERGWTHRTVGGRECSHTAAMRLDIRRRRTRARLPGRDRTVGQRHSGWASPRRMTPSTIGSGGPYPRPTPCYSLPRPDRLRRPL